MSGSYRGRAVTVLEEEIMQISHFFSPPEGCFRAGGTGGCKAEFETRLWRSRPFRGVFSFEVCRVTGEEDGSISERWKPSCRG